MGNTLTTCSCVRGNKVVNPIRNDATNAEGPGNHADHCGHSSSTRQQQQHDSHSYKNSDTHGVCGSPTKSRRHDRRHYRTKNPDLLRAGAHPHKLLQSSPLSQHHELSEEEKKRVVEEMKKSVKQYIQAKKSETGGEAAVYARACGPRDCGSFECV